MTRLTQADKVCIDLFSGLGGFSQAFRDHPEWSVVEVEIDYRLEPDLWADVTELRPEDLPEPDVVLASPPCPAFSPAAIAANWHRDDAENLLPQRREVVQATRVVYHTLWLIQGLEPKWWWLENPRGMLRRVAPFEPQGSITYCQFGTPYMKPTDLYGHHPPSFHYPSCKRGERCHSSPGEVDGKTRQDTYSYEGLEEQAPRSLAVHPALSQAIAKVPENVSEFVLWSVENPDSHPRESPAPNGAQRTLAEAEPA